ncbi:MAG TPA: ROK family protein [Flavisolibacter sp.]|nr:ROK family protein [Flavisolibacter sp.]
MNQGSIIGIDLGGTNIRGGLVEKNGLKEIQSKKLTAHHNADDVLQQLFELTDTLINTSVTAIGIGVPGLVDQQTGTVFDVVNIPSWKKVPLKRLMEDRYKLPVAINNDANCFALGEYYFGKGFGVNSMVGLTIGTGLGSGLILNKRLHTGSHCGAGEFGMIPYKDHCIEYYASGQFFKNVFNTEGEEAFVRAQAGEIAALDMYAQLGNHLGNAIKTILFALDVELIVMGGSVSKAYSFFEKTMWSSIREFPFQATAEGLKVEVSELHNSGIVGAAALHYDQHQ